jgi:hypothetical protein
MRRAAVNQQGASGPNWYVVTAMIHRMHEFYKEQALLPKRAVALQMWKKIGGPARGSNQRLVVSSQQKEGKA